MNRANRKTTDDCQSFSPSIAPYVDGELDPGHAVDMEAHVIACTPCAEKVALIRAMRQSLKRTAASRCPAALRARLAGAVQQERARAEKSEEPEAEGMSAKLVRLRYAVGLAAAAGVVFAMGMSRYMQTAQGNLREASPIASVAGYDRASTAVGFDSLLDEIVSLHANPLPPETTNPDELPRWDPFVGVPVRRPPFQPFGARFNGARVLAAADHRFAALQYTVNDGHRVTMYVFNPRVVPVRATRLEPRVVRHRPVLVGRLRGYSVAAAEQSGVGYAIASDLDADESTQLVLAALQQ